MERLQRRRTRTRRALQVTSSTTDRTRTTDSRTTLTGISITGPIESGFAEHQSSDNFIKFILKIDHLFYVFRKSTYFQKSYSKGIYEVLKIKFPGDVLPQRKMTGTLETDVVRSEVEEGSGVADGPDSTRSSRSASSSERATAGTGTTAHIHTMPLRA